jgi:hypothetical protein
MSDIEQIRTLLETSTLAGRVDSVAIQEAEKSLGVQFPPSYRTFISEFGAALCSGFEIAGLFDAKGNDDGPPLWSDVVASTTQRRRVSGGLIPNAYVAISDDGGDYTFYIDTSRPDPLGECPVIVLGNGADAVVVAGNFFDFLRSSFDGNLSF